MTNQIAKLLDGGDWACAYKERNSLSMICYQLAHEQPDVASRATHVAKLARKDMAEAARSWEILSQEIRATL